MKRVRQLILTIIVIIVYTIGLAQSPPAPIFDDIVGIYIRSKVPLESLRSTSEYKNLTEGLIANLGVVDISAPFAEAKRISLKRTLYIEMGQSSTPRTVKTLLEESALFNLVEYTYRSVLANVSGLSIEDESHERVQNGCSNPSSYNDPGSTSTSHLEAMEMPCAWSLTHGSQSIHVGVVDAGFYPSHPDLSGKIANSPTLFSTSSSNRRHGTAVAGGVAGIVNNNLCVAGSGYNTRVKLYQVTGTDLIDEVWDAYLDGNPIITVSMVKTSPSFVQTHHDAVEEITEGGSVVTWAVLGGYTTTFEGIPGCILVGQSDVNGNYVPYGPGTSGINHPDVGIEILVPILNSARLQDPNNPSNVCGIGSANSSMAAPHVAGTAALMLAENPCLTPAQIEDILTTNTNVVPNYSSHASTLNGAGNLNAYLAVLEAQQGSFADAEISGPIGVDPNATYNYSVPNYAGVSYSWTVSGPATLISGQGSRSVYIRTSSSFSSYQVQCTISKDGCSQTTSMVSFNDGGGPGSFSVTAYPNPTSGNLHVSIDYRNPDDSYQQSPGAKQATSEELLEHRITLHDPFGREVYSVTDKDDIVIDTRNLREGFYTLRVTYEEETVSQRIKISE